MSFKYKPHGMYGAPFDSNRCKASVHEAGRGMFSHQCTRKPWRDGWCKQHHPDSVAKRRVQREARWERKRALKEARSPFTRLRKAQEEVARLKARIAELEGEGK